ncbi:MAG: MGMT family protein [Fluviicola sp.]
MKTIKLSEENADFFDRVYEVVKLIPFGRATSYGAIASYLGAKRSSRMVGWAMNAAHSNPEIPAHRVVNRNGQLTGKMHFNTPTLMQELLEKEGVKVENDQIK